jgi:cytochrome c oxidase subunit 2
MRLDVIALPQNEYEAWAEAQRKVAVEPDDPAARRGRELFLSGSCMLCHAVRGTTANARKAPDLTHVASRAHLAAGRLANTRENLTDWIADPQRLKPGANMPAHLLIDEDLKALVAYVETLK